MKHVSLGITIQAMLGFFLFGGCATVPRPSMVTAAYEGDVTRVKQLIHDGEDVNGADSMGTTALQCSVSRQDVKTLIVLLQNGADPNKGNTFGIPPWYAAVAGSDTGLFKDKPVNLMMVKLLIAAGADPAREPKGEHAVTGYAVGKINAGLANPELIKVLVQAGAKPKVALLAQGEAATYVREAARNPPTQEAIDAYRAQLKKEMAKYLEPEKEPTPVAAPAAKPIQQLKFEVPE
jgi:ankyrin repeat protein